MGVKNVALRQLKSSLYLERELTADFIIFADEIIPNLNLTGYKIEKKKATARFILHNLVCNGLMGRTVADSRDIVKNRFRTRVWDAIIKAGLAKMVLGSESSRQVTRYYVTRTLLEQRRLWELRMLCATENLSGLVLLTSGKVDWITGEPLPENGRRKPVSIRERIEATCQRDPNDINSPDPRALQNGLDHFQEIEDHIERINENNLVHSWIAYAQVQGVKSKRRRVAFQPRVELRQVHSGQLFRCVRLYTWGPMGAQSMTKKQRRSILIDREPVVELDYSGYQTRMLYHLANIDPKGDVYRPEKVLPRLHSFGNMSPSRKRALRQLVKRATNICWNAGTRSKAVGAVRKVLKDADKRIQKAIYRTEKSGATDLLSRIEDVHHRLSHRFYSEAGVTLMTSDGNIMLCILLNFVEARKPALGVHDSLVVRESDADFAEETMTRVYESFFQLKPLIHRV